MSKKRRHKPKHKKHPETTQQKLVSAQEELHQAEPPQRHLSAREIREVYSKPGALRGSSEGFWNFHRMFTAATIGLIIIILVIGIMIISGGIKVSRELSSSSSQQEDNGQ